MHVTELSMDSAFYHSNLLACCVRIGLVRILYDSLALSFTALFVFAKETSYSFRFYLRLFDYEPWNHIPQVIEGGTCNDRLHF